MKGQQLIDARLETVDNLDDHFMDRNESDEDSMDGYVSWSDSDGEGDKSEGNSSV